MLSVFRRAIPVGTRAGRTEAVVCWRPFAHTNARNYHTYPDPNEKPVIVTSTSTQSKTYNKADPFFLLDEKFKMEKLFPGVSVSKGIGASQQPPTLTTVLDNGLTVSTQELPGMMSSIALLVRAGSGYEVQSGPNVQTGATHFLELNAFRSTANRSHEELMHELEKFGGMVQCVTNRENIVYVMDVMRHDSQRAFNILADTVMNPTFPEPELEDSRSIVEIQQTELPSETFSRDLMQRAAYQGSPLSHHHFCPVEELNNVTADRLHSFRRDHYYAGNCIVAVTGMDHATAVEQVRAAFASMPAKRDGSGQVIVRRASDHYAQSTYTGGMLMQTRDLKEPFVKLAMGFEIGGWHDPLLVPLCVMQQVLGGGSSFSAGGPGKGMFTRLYTQVLNRNYWTESVESFLSMHERSGILGIDGACPADKLVDLVKVIVQQFVDLAIVPVSAEELQRAKNMLKSSMMMQLESRLVQCEDIARQMATYGHRDSQAKMCEKIDAVTAEQLMQVARRMLSHPPAVGAVGHDLQYLPAYPAIVDYTNKYYKAASDMVRSRGRFVE